MRWILVVLVSVALVAACTGAPDRRHEAESIESTVRAMPGVENVAMRYSNDIIGGTMFDLTVDMPEGNAQQIEIVAARIDELRGEDFADYEPTLKIMTGRTTSVNVAARFDPGDVGLAASMTRELADQAQSVEFFVGTDRWSVQVQYAQAPGTALDATLRTLAGRPAAIEVMPAERVAAPVWRVDAGFTGADKARIDRQLSTVPGELSWVGVDQGRVTHLTFGLVDPEHAYQDVVAAIRAVDAGPTHPLDLVWAWNADPAGYDQARWAGSAAVGMCTGPPRDEKLVPEAAALQQRIRAEFEKC